MGRNPYGAKHWYVANELAYVTGARKMTATASVIGPIWTEIGQGAAGWGDSTRLKHLWNMVTATEPSLDPDPGRGIDELMWQWGITGLPSITEETLVRTTDASIRNWGGGLPMLRGIDAAQIQHVLMPLQEDPTSCQAPRAIYERQGRGGEHMNSTNTLKSLDLHIQELEPMDVPDDWDERIKGISAGLALVGIAVAIT